MDAHLGISQFQQSYECASEDRCVVDTLDLAVDRRITAVWFPLRSRHGDSLQSSPELRIDSPVYRSPERSGGSRIDGDRFSRFSCERLQSEIPATSACPIIDRRAGLGPAIVGSLWLSSHRCGANISGRA
ncbi:unnamed protein product [Macrosiphum euphorbiae]|uniref:Uncharacterized protein n=1 Tax=Macrosiphum euphorbiae TaxID=13131 RepID=A0AAV0W1E3_9HEMI|nr:unnamed protein product [Macrosiphum euphorbiae]